MATSIVISQDTRRPRKDNTFPIIFRLTHNTKTTAITTGYAVKKKDWDARNRIIRSSYKGAESPQRLNNLLTKKKASMIDTIARIDDKGELPYLTVKQLKERLLGQKGKMTLFSFAEKLIQDLVKAQRIGTARTYKDVMGVVKNFNHNRDITFDALNLDFLNRFETWHLSRGNTLGGLGAYMRTIRAIYNKAIKAGFADQEGYPFKDYTIRSGKPRKRAITIEMLQKMQAVELDPGTSLFRDRNIFFMSFYLNGMPYSDLAHLKLSNIVDGRIKYQRRKTNEQYDIKIHESLKPIIKPFTDGKSKEDYLLSIIKRSDPILQYKDIKWARKRYNDNLQRIAEMAGIEEHITSYVSRHSFASSADDLGIPVTAISRMLGHKKISTTQAYLDNLRKSKLDEYQDEVLGRL